MILAAGRSSRMGRPKAALPLRGMPFVEHVYRACSAAKLAPIILVVGPHADATTAALPPDAAISTLHNPDVDGGPLASLKVALGALEGDTSIAGVLMALVDHPDIRPETYTALVQRLESTPEAAIVRPSFGGRNGHPVIFTRAVWPELLETPNDRGARAVVRRDPSRVATVEVPDPGILRDIDTPADLAQAPTRRA